jgi:hypothetical protein
MDMFHLTPASTHQSYLFLGQIVNNARDWKTFTFPRCSMVHIIIAGAGGNGGTGFGRTQNSAGGGGGGGGSGAMCRVLAPRSAFPDTIYMLAGYLSETYIAINRPSTTYWNLIMVAFKGTNGGNGTGSAAGSAGAGGVATGLGDCLFGCTTKIQSSAGVAGGAGGAQTGAVGTSVVALTSSVLTGGAGGAGCSSSTNFAGGDITTNGLIPTVPGGAGGGANSGANGRWNSYGMFMATGGAGGGSNNSGAPGAGGNAAPGCGGGGGGVGTSTGAIGLGGPGFVFIQCW